MLYLWNVIKTHPSLMEPLNHQVVKSEQETNIIINILYKEYVSTTPTCLLLLIFRHIIPASLQIDSINF